MAKRKLKSNKNKPKENPPAIGPDGLPVVKRGRGRPRKYPAQPPTKQWVRPETESEKSESSSSSSSEESEEEFVPQSALRKRGTGKNYLEVDSDFDMDSEDEEEGDFEDEEEAEGSGDDGGSENPLNKILDEMFHKRRYWGTDRRQDFVIVHQSLTPRQLTWRLIHRRLKEQKKMIRKKEVKNSKEYFEKYQETMDPYRTFRDHANLPWQVEIKKVLVSKEKEEWSPEEVKEIAKEHDLEVLQVEAFIAHQKNGAPRIRKMLDIPHSTRLAAREYYSTHTVWKNEEGEEFLRQNPCVSKRWFMRFLKSARYKNRNRKRGGLEEDTDNEGGEVPEKQKRTKRGNHSAEYLNAIWTKIEEICKRQRYWNKKRHYDFNLVTQVHRQLLSERLHRVRFTEQEAMMMRGEIRNAEEYREKYCKKPDTYETFRYHQDLKWQNEIKEKMDSGEKLDWNEEECNKIAEENGLELLQVQAYIIYQKNGAPTEFKIIKKKKTLPEHVRKAVQAIYATKKFWSPEEREDFCAKHPEANTQWVIEYLTSLRKRDRQLEQRAIKGLEEEDEEEEEEDIVKEPKPLNRIDLKVRKAVQQIFETRKEWSMDEKIQFCKEHPEATVVWLKSYLGNLKAKDKLLEKRAAIRREQEEREAEAPKAPQLTQDDIQEKIKDNFMIHKGSWNEERRADFHLVTGNQLAEKQLTTRLYNIRTKDRTTCIRVQTVKSEKEYDEKFCKVEDPYVSLREHQDLPWQLDIKGKLDSKEQLEWSQYEIEAIAMEHDLEALQIEAYIMNQRYGGSQLVPRFGVSQIPQDVREKAKAIFATNKNWSFEQRYAFCKMHPGANMPWLRGYLQGLRKKEKQRRERRDPSPRSRAIQDEEVVRDVVEELVNEVVRVERLMRVEAVNDIEPNVPVVQNQPFSPNDLGGYQDEEEEEEEYYNPMEEMAEDYREERDMIEDFEMDYPDFQQEEREEVVPIQPNREQMEVHNDIEVDAPIVQREPLFSSNPGHKENEALPETSLSSSQKTTSSKTIQIELDSPVSPIQSSSSNRSEHIVNHIQPDTLRIQDGAEQQVANQEQMEMEVPIVQKEPPPLNRSNHFRQDAPEEPMEENQEEEREPVYDNNPNVPAVQNQPSSSNSSEEAVRRRTRQTAKDPAPTAKSTSKRRPELSPKPARALRSGGPETERDRRYLQRTVAAIEKIKRPAKRDSQQRSLKREKAGEEEEEGEEGPVAKIQRVENQPSSSNGSGENVGFEVESSAVETVTPSQSRPRQDEVDVPIVQRESYQDAPEEPIEPNVPAVQNQPSSSRQDEEEEDAAVHNIEPNTPRLQNAAQQQWEAEDEVMEVCDGVEVVVPQVSRQLPSSNWSSHARQDAPKKRMEENQEEERETVNDVEKAASEVQMPLPSSVLSGEDEEESEIAKDLMEIEQEEEEEGASNIEPASSEVQHEDDEVESPEAQTVNPSQRRSQQVEEEEEDVAEEAMEGEQEEERDLAIEQNSGEDEEESEDSMEVEQEEEEEAVNADEPVSPEVQNQEKEDEEEVDENVDAISPEARKEAEEPMEEEQHQPSSSNSVPEEEAEEVIRWNGNVFKCSDILKKRRVLPDHLQFEGSKKHEVLEEAYSRCKTVDANAVRIAIVMGKTARIDAPMSDTEIKDWFRRRRAYDFEDEVPTDAYNQKIFQSWLYFGHQLNEEEELLTLVAEWAEIPIDEARKDVKLLTKKLPQVVFGSKSVPLRDILEHIDVFFSIDRRKHLEKSPNVQYSLETRFINCYFHGAKVFDEEMMAETGMTETEVKEWFDARLICGLENKKGADGVGTSPRTKLVKFWVCCNEFPGENSLKMVAKWAGCHEQDVVKFFKEREQVLVEGDAERVVDVREQENQGEQARHEHHVQNYVGLPETVKQLLREDDKLLRRT